MDILECINTRRSYRTYTEEIISDEVINELITSGTKAATGSGTEPWGFVVIKNKEEINELSEKIKINILDNYDKYPYLKQYENWMKNPKYNIFNNANCILLIYGDTNSHWYKYDCTLAAGNIMLAAYSIKIGTCWIGFAEDMCDTKEFKGTYNVPENYNLVCPMSIGYMKNKLSFPKRKEPLIFYSK